MEITEFTVQDVFGSSLNKVGVLPEQITKLNKFSARLMWIFFPYLEICLKLEMKY